MNDNRHTHPPLRQGDPISFVRVRQADGDRSGEETIYDFGATYPLGEIHLTEGGASASASPARVSYSLDGRAWSEAFAAALGGVIQLEDAVHARYVRLTGEAGRFAAGRGYAAEPAEDWTRLFHRKAGWTGSDGIYSIPLNGVEAQGRAADGRTLLLFGDTFIGGVDEATDARVNAVIINNSYALLDGDRPDPAAIAFHWEQDGEAPESAIVPRTPGALAHEDTYYWLQDGTSVGGKFHCFPLIIGPDPDGPEGFQFAVHGITHVSAPIGEQGPLLAEQEQADTPLYFRSAGGHTTYFGAAILPLTEEAGVPNPDGFVYVYGLQNDGATRLVAARVPADDLARFERWTYWDGREWTDRKEDCAPLVPEVSSELSVSPMTGGFLDGKYVIVCQQGGISGNRVALYAGDSPVGPFGPAIPLYAASESEEGNGIYTYNAKAHPHLSRPGELLASYNVNTTSWDAHEAFGGIYRPRFIRIRQIV
ncbi:DUF4185 domain-containing protein [Cohnella nanjingensis]|uniref:DUF5005 domain-containing protein n=1 Tax=Cohnella nanjingensis TaxID=1387779 RepID=A0A7X0VEN6_9BACL|nr:DUF4185 domain-containing protein [Cohnella nanjingensis]MBB6671197.1 DUF5005 domain-containing protein [Cohnella nanjingensis]